ncbi:hypothetical protein C8R47DRAFT_1133574 [Mycena vitilis]|nr:hypothetical protein C8R47DRAFT_1133574 [Mycena vitilis]
MELFEIPNIRDRLRSNHLPSEAEKTAIVSSIAVAELRLKELKAPRSDDPLDDEDVDLALVLSQHILDYSSLLAPIRLLSEDLLQLIFLHHNLHGFLRIGPYLVTQYTPKMFPAVSRHWRNVACATPELWSTFKLRFQGGRYSSPEWTRIRLERSKNTSLSVFFHWEGVSHVDVPDRPRHRKAVADTVGAILCHAERWAHVALPLHYQFLRPFSSAQDRFLRLQTIAFLNIPDLLSKDLQMFAHAPQLRFVSLHSTRSPDHYPPLPWNQLTHASLNASETFLIPAQVMALAPELRGVVISDGPSLSDPRLPAPPGPSPTLRKVVLLGQNSKLRCVTRTLDSLNAPSAKELLIVKCEVWDPLPIPEFVLRSECCLASRDAGTAGDSDPRGGATRALGGVAHPRDACSNGQHTQHRHQRCA